MVKTERLEDGTYMVVDPRYTQQPELRLSSGRPLPEWDALVGPLALFALIAFMWVGLKDRTLKKRIH